MEPVFSTSTDISNAGYSFVRHLSLLLLHQSSVRFLDSKESEADMFPFGPNIVGTDKWTGAKFQMTSTPLRRVGSQKSVPIRTHRYDTDMYTHSLQRLLSFSVERILMWLISVPPWPDPLQIGQQYATKLSESFLG
jgi:hypothetical protein